MSRREQHEQCSEIKVVENEIEHIRGHIAKIEDKIDDRDREFQNLKVELNEYKVVNTYLADKVKEILNIKEKINSTVIKYFAIIVISIILFVVVKDIEVLKTIFKFLG